MPSLSFAMAQVTRLSGLEKFPRSYEARKETGGRISESVRKRNVLDQCC